MRATRGPILIALLSSLSACASEPIPSPGWREEPTRVLSSFSSPDALRAGAAKVSLDPPFPVPMAGYAGVSWIDLRSLRDPLFARALVIESGTMRVGLVAADRVLIPPALRPAVEAREEFRRSGVREWIVGATHTHTAPGAHVDNTTAELFGTGLHDPLVVEDLARRIAEALEAAASSLEPCRVGSASGPPGETASAFLSFNRRDPTLPAERRVDLAVFQRASASAGGPAGSTIAVWYLFAAHPTLIPFYLRRTSGDYAGAASRRIETSIGGAALFANAASADLAAGASGDEAAVGWEARLERIGRVLAAEVTRLASAAGAERDDPSAPGDGGLAFVRARVKLPPRHPWRVPFFGRRISEEYPEDALLQCLRLGNHLILTVPAEVESSLGAEIREAALARSGAAGVSLWTLTDEYIGYAFSEKSHAAGGKALHLAVYGPELAELLVARLAELAGMCVRG